MAVTTTSRRQVYTGNGIATVFPFYFKVFKPEDLYVLQQTDTGIQSTLDYGTDFSAVLNADQDVNPGGSVTLLNGSLATNYTLLLTSDIAELQQVVLTNLGGFYPDVINDALDRLTICVQQLQNGVNQSIKLGMLDNLSSAQLPPASQRAGKFLYFDADGNVSFVAATPAGSMVFAVTPAGTIDGTNRTFTLPAGANLVEFFWNGVLQNPLAGDYSLSGLNITMAKAPIPSSGPGDSGDTLYALIFG